jgi:hypothetical protein
MRKRVYALFSWVVIPSLWLALIGWTFIQWRRGETSYEQLVTTAGTVAMLWFFSAGVPLIKTMLARRNRTPSTYRPTRLEG